MRKNGEMDLESQIWVSCSSGGRESAYNAGDPSSIPGSGSSPGEGIGYPLQYSWVSLEAQIVKNLPATQETWVWSLDWDDPLEEGMATHSSIFAWRIPMDRGAWQVTGHVVTKSQTWLSDYAQVHGYVHNSFQQKSGFRLSCAQYLSVAYKTCPSS